MKIHYVIAIHIMRWLTNFYDFRFKWTATSGSGIHPTKAWLSQLVNYKNAIRTWEHFRRTICNKILFQTWKDATETYGMLHTYYVEALGKFRKRFHRKRPALFKMSLTIWPRWASRHFLSLPIVQTLLPVTFGYSLTSEAVVMWQLSRWKRLWRRSLTRSHKRTSMGRSRSCWNGTTSALQPEDITSKGTRVSCVYSQ